MLIKEQFSLDHSEPAADITGVGSTLGKIIERPKGKVVLMRWIMERVRMREMRRPDFNAPARFTNAMQLFHGPYHIFEVLNDVAEDDAAESVLLDWPGKTFQVMRDVHSVVGSDIDAAGCPRVSGVSASHVKDVHGGDILDKSQGARKSLVR